MKKEKKLIKRTVLFLLISSAALLLTAVGDYRGEWWNVVAAIAVGVLFWLFLILGYVSFWKLSKARKQQEKKNRSVSRGKPGIIVFFSNRYATAADIAMAVSLIVVIISQFVPVGEIISLAAAAVFVFSAQMHCILNGINYKYVGKSKTVDHEAKHGSAKTGS